MSKLPAVQSLAELETALDRGSVQLLGNNGRWYDIRRNGATKTWKRRPGLAEIPCKVGFREAFRLGVEGDACNYELRLRPADFNARTRA